MLSKILVITALAISALNIFPVSAARAEKIITFGGYEWTVKSRTKNGAGPKCVGRK